MPLTLPQKLEAIRKACIAANESILDLKFGCKVTDAYGEPWTLLYKRWIPIGHEEEELRFFFLNEKTYEIHEERKKILKSSIIGRDILVSDILEEMKDYVVDSDGQFLALHIMTETGLNAYACTRVFWNLLRPSLDDQEEATISFIYEILCSTTQK